MEEDTAARGLGEAGHVQIAHSIWNRCVPRDLLKKYKRRKRDERGANRGKAVKALGAMLEAVRLTTKGIKRTKRGRTVSVFLRPKNKEKCRRILNPKKLHAADNRRPP